jgi:ElaA protein
MFSHQALQLKDISSITWHKIMLLRSACFVTEQHCVYTDPDEIDFTAFHCFTTKSDQILAYCRFYQTTDWHIGRVVTDKSERHKGYARQILKFSIQQIEYQDQNPRIAISAQVYLSQFYESAGFKITSGIYLEDGIPHVSMVFQPNEYN